RHKTTSCASCASCVPFPPFLLVREDIHRACARRGVIVRISVDAFGGASFAAGPGGHEFAILTEGHGAPKLIVGLCVRRFDVSRLSPGCTGACEEVDGACVFSGLGVLLAVDALRAAVFDLSAHSERIAVA